MEPAAGAFTGTRDSCPLQDGIKDSVASSDCPKLFGTPRPCNDSIHVMVLLLLLLLLSIEEL